MIKVKLDPTELWAMINFDLADHWLKVYFEPTYIWPNASLIHQTNGQKSNLMEHTYDEQLALSQQINDQRSVWFSRPVTKSQFRPN